MGPDLFDGTVLLRDEGALAAIAQLLRRALNHGEIPKYFKEGRMVLLSKSGKPEVELG